MSSYTRYNLSGKSEGKKRAGGYIHLAEIGADIQGEDNRLRLEMYSKVRSDVPPIVLELILEDARIVAAILTDYLSGKMK